MALIKLLFVSLCLFCLAGCENGKIPDDIDLSQIMVNIAETLPPVLAMVSAASYLIGITLVIKGVFKLKEFGEARTMMTSHLSAVPTIITLCVGGFLIFFPTSIEIGLQTIFAYSTPLSYSSQDTATKDLVDAIVMIMQIIGSIAFIRGMMLIKASTGQGAQPGSFSKGITFVIAGILAINIYGTWEVLVNTIT